jgi:GNAT superfamily N-acetyltransferase
MSDADSARYVYGGASDTAPKDDRTEVEACVFCMSAEVALCFEHQMVEGQRVAVPSWVGLCTNCVTDVQSQSFESIIARARGTSWDDFDAQDLIQVATAMTVVVRPYRRRGPGRFDRSSDVLNHVVVRAAEPSDDVAGSLVRSWGGTAMAVHGQLYDAGALPALVAVRDSETVGVLTYVVSGDSLEIVSCDAHPSGRGSGRALVDAVVDLARSLSLRQVWCTTTNDNLPAIGFWQALAFSLVAVRPGAVEAARKLKPSIPRHGYRGLPIRDELDLERLL